MLAAKCIILAITLIGVPHALSDSSALINRLESVPTAETRVYQLRDRNGTRMDCLKLFQPADDEFAGIYFGVYHAHKGGILYAHLARSRDLRSWQHLAALDDHASQPTIHVCSGGGYLLAYEKDAPNSCWVRLRFYNDLPGLLSGKHQRQFDVPRTLAPTAEGTPSIESVKLGESGIDKSEIQLRFHYYKNGDVDQLARGTLTDFKSWRAEASDEINTKLISQGWHGNLGDRDRFIWQDQAYYLQEIQKKKKDWGSWRVCLSDQKGMPIRTLSIRTDKGATAFANPTATWITDAKSRSKLVVTLFLLSEGNPSSELGTLLYVINPAQ